MATTQIIWNGVDGYIETSNLNQDHSTTSHADGSVSLFTQREEFKSFPVIQITESDVPRDADGELDLDGLFVTESFNIYRNA